ncbi:MAG: undecaprenyl phosphate translocase family protein [Verrucomicrobiota bacterium]
MMDGTYRAGLRKEVNLMGDENFCVIIPAYMEAGRISDVVRESLQYCERVLVVDDGSEDATSDRAEEAGAVVIRHKQNRGKGAALQTALQYAGKKGFDFVVILDADGQHSPADIPAFVEKHRDGNFDVIVGSRMSDVQNMPWIRRMTNRFMSWLLSRKMGQSVPDTQCGYRLYSKKALPYLSSVSGRFAAESEALLHLADNGIKIGEVPIRAVYGDEKSKIRPGRDTLRFFSMLRRYECAKRKLQAADLAKSPALSPVIIVKSCTGGVLMGLANLVPGISGGTMLLAVGIYPRFIDAIAEVTTLRFRTASLTVLGSVVVAAGLSILLLAGVVKDLVLGYRWVMYSLFIGLTLGGAPIIWRMIKAHSKAMWLGALGGFAGMGALALAQQSGVAPGSEEGGQFIMLFLAGVAGASAMILPGVSGGYLLLVLGQYVPILSAIDDFKIGLKAGDMGVVFGIGLSVVLPVGLGVVIGIAGVSNILRILLSRFRRTTLGALLGLLLGAVVGLWPFQEAAPPTAGDVIKGQVMTEESIALVEPEDYPTSFFSPSAFQIAASLGLILSGFALTYALSFMGRDKEQDEAAASA